MKMLIKNLRVTGEAIVYGAVSCNGTGSKSIGNGKFAKNVILIKKDNDGISFTSAGTQRKAMFNNEVPRQPNDKIFAKYYPRLLGSAVGILRGLFLPAEGAKRKGPINVLDAYDITEKSLVFLETCTNSKPSNSVEENVASAKKKAEKNGEEYQEGDKDSNSNFYMKENAPKRYQQMEMSVSAEALGWFSLDDDTTIKTARVDAFLDSLRNEFFAKELETTNVKVSDFESVYSVIPTKKKGIHLTDAQMKHYVLDALLRFTNLQIHRNNAKFEAQPQSFKVELTWADNRRESMSISDFFELLQTEKIGFQKFYRPCEAA